MEYRKPSLIDDNFCGGGWRNRTYYMKVRIIIIKKTKTPWSESASELYRPSDRRLSAK
jgi:hypothetical protein